MADKGINTCSCGKSMQKQQEQTEAESFAMTMLKSSTKTSKLTIIVLSVIIGLLILVVMWKDYNYKQLLENATFETATTVTQDTEGEGSNSFIGGDNIGEADSNSN